MKSAVAAEVEESRMETLLTSELGAPLPLHVSLSRLIVLTADEKDSFVNSVHKNISGCGVRP
jgi:U6 snRNA phosphodiesterase